MKLLYPLIILLLSCSTKPEVIHGCLDGQACNYNSSATIDDNSCVYEYNQCGLCTLNDDDCSCWFGNWESSIGVSYYTINENNFIYRSAFSCSGIIRDFNIIEFADTCLQTNYSLELANNIYSFKLFPDNHDLMITNFTSPYNDNCLLDTLIRITEIPCE